MHHQDIGPIGTRGSDKTYSVVESLLTEYRGRGGRAIERGKKHDQTRSSCCVHSKRVLHTKQEATKQWKSFIFVRHTKRCRKRLRYIKIQCLIFFTVCLLNKTNCAKHFCYMFLPAPSRHPPICTLIFAQYQRERCHATWR